MSRPDIFVVSWGYLMKITEKADKIAADSQIYLFLHARQDLRAEGLERQSHRALQ